MKARIVFECDKCGDCHLYDGNWDCNYGYCTDLDKRVNKNEIHPDCGYLVEEESVKEQIAKTLGVDAVTGEKI